MPQPGTPAKSASTGLSPGGRTVLWLVVPQLVFGAAFATIPERTAFVPEQIALLLHVVVAAGMAPLFVWWLWRHAAGRRRKTERGTGGGLVALLRHGVALLALLAFATGAFAAYRGRGSLASSAHALMGLGVAGPLVLHLLLESRRTAAWVVLGGVAATLGLGASLRALDLGLPLAPDWPPFGFEQRPQAAYDSSRWCGECHLETYREWSGSMHARNMQIPHVRESLAEDLEKFGRLEVDADLAHFGSKEVHATCVQCHAPETLYGDEQTPVLASARAEEEGIGCAFCHTVRGFNRNDPLYVSAPETVRRYVGQGSGNPVLRTMGNWLIRWMPETHRSDYSSPFLASSEFCFGCHNASNGTYPQWRGSEFAKHHPPDPNDGSLERQRTTPREAYAAATQCQDCHMAETPTGAPVVEHGRAVPWGPEHARSRNHRFLGGNVGAAMQLSDPEFAALERFLRQGALDLKIDAVTRDADAVRVRVTLRNLKIGHNYPAGEGAGNREPYLQLRLVDAAGAELGATTPPPHSLLDRTPTDSPRVVIQRDDGGTGKVLQDTSIPPGGARTFDIRLALGRAPPESGRVVVELRSNHEPGGPILVASADLRAGPGPEIPSDSGKMAAPVATP